MVQLLILYYLNIKPTHGYEIQKFVTLNEMEQWTTIRSGSIYYAMTQLEKKGAIELQALGGDKEKSKRVYSITEKGRELMFHLALEALKKPLSDEKFVLYPILGVLDKEMVSQTLADHIETLKVKLSTFSSWLETKSNTGIAMERASVTYMIRRVEDQIHWHRLLLTHYDETQSAVDAVRKHILQFNC